MMLRIYHGIPAPPRAAGSRTAPPSFAGVFYLSLGFTLLYAALDQGQRLDWWRSGVFTPLFLAGSLLLLFSLIRRLRSANPLVALPYLHKWNTQVCAFLLFLFRFSLSRPSSLFPEASLFAGRLSQYRRPCYGRLCRNLRWFRAPYLLSRGADTRLILAFGFACTGSGLLPQRGLHRRLVRAELLHRTLTAVGRPLPSWVWSPLSSRKVSSPEGSPAPVDSHLLRLFHTVPLQGRSAPC